MGEVYLDNAATTQVAPEVVDAVTACMRDDFGNPSSAHRLGLVAANHVDASRRAMLAALGDHAGRGQLLWTSGGTEADALAVLGFFIVASVPSPRAQPGVFAATRTRDVTPV